MTTPNVRGAEETFDAYKERMRALTLAERRAKYNLKVIWDSSRLRKPYIAPKKAN